MRDAPSRKRAIIARDVSSQPAAIAAPARLMPIVRVKRSSSRVSSPKSSESRPFACFRARSIWKRRSPAVTNPCANHRSSSESGREVGDAVAIAEDLDGRPEARAR